MFVKLVRAGGEEGMGVFSVYEKMWLLCESQIEVVGYGTVVIRHKNGGLKEKTLKTQ